MSNIIIPETLREMKINPNEQKRFNFNFNRFENNSKYEVRHDTYTTNNTTNNNISNENKGLFRQLLDIILMPITLPYSIGKDFWIKHDLSAKIQLERKKVKAQRLMKKYLLTQDKVYDDELI